MVKAHEAENMYILQEIESKLNSEDKQKWLESMGSGIDKRSVEDVCNWMDKQAYIRRLSLPSNKMSDYSSNYKQYPNMVTTANKIEQLVHCTFCYHKSHS